MRNRVWLAGVLRVCEPVRLAMLDHGKRNIVQAVIRHPVQGLGGKLAVVLTGGDLDPRCIGEASVQVGVVGLLWSREKLDLYDGVLMTWRRLRVRLGVWQGLDGILECHRLLRIDAIARGITVLGHGS